MGKVGLGLIGLGYVGKIHLKNSLKLENSKLVAVADVSEKALKSAKNAGVQKTFTDYEQLLREPDVDAVIISLPTHLHLPCVKLAAEANKHIFLEKPIARNVVEAKEIISLAQKNSVKLMVGYPLRFSSDFQKLKERISDEMLDSVQVAYATYVSTGPFFHRAESNAPVPVPEWWFNKELTGGGALVDLGVHIINIMRWYFGEITDISCELGHRFNLDLEDHAVCLAKFESGTTGVITAGWFSQQYLLEFQLMGTVTNIHASRVPGGKISTALRMLTTGTTEFHKPHFNELKYFVDCVNSDLCPSPSGEDGLKDLEAVTRAYENQLFTKTSNDK